MAVLTCKRGRGKNSCFWPQFLRFSKIVFLLISTFQIIVEIFIFTEFVSKKDIVNLYERYFPPKLDILTGNCSKMIGDWFPTHIEWLYIEQVRVTNSCFACTFAMWKGMSHKSLNLLHALALGHTIEGMLVYWQGILISIVK